jgi:hypothetical protein
MRSGSWIVLVVAACGSKQPTPPALQPTLEPAPAGGREQPVAPVGHGLGAVGSVEGPRKLTMFPQLENYPVYVTDVDGLMLFDTEKLEAANMVATWARTAGFLVEDPQRTREVFARAARGQDVVTGKACGAPLWKLPAAERWRKELKAKGRIEVGAYCTPTCWLMVNVSEGLDIGMADAGRTAFYAAPYDPTKPWRSELPAALAHVFDWHGPGEPGTPMSQVPGSKALAGIPDLAFAVEGAPDPEVPPALVTAAESCVGVGAAGVLIEIDRGGKVTHCEHDDRHIIANVAGATCVCSALGGKVLGGGKGLVSRHPVGISGRETPTVSKTGAKVTVYARAARAQDPMTHLYEPIVTDKSIAEWEPGTLGDELRPCFASATDDTKVEAAFTLEFDGTGAATKVAITRTAGTLTPAMQTCAEGVLRKVVAPCPAVPHATAQGEFTAGYRKP